MISEIKYIIRVSGSMPDYETSKSFDTTVTHTSYSGLCDAVARQGLPILSIAQRLVDVLDDESYGQIKSDRRITVLYHVDRGVSPDEDVVQVGVV